MQHIITILLILCKFLNKCLRSVTTLNKKKFKEQHQHQHQDKHQQQYLPRWIVGTAKPREEEHLVRRMRFAWSDHIISGLSTIIKMVMWHPCKPSTSSQRWRWFVGFVDTLPVMKPSREPLLTSTGANNKLVNLHLCLIKTYFWQWSHDEFQFLQPFP